MVTYLPLIHSEDISQKIPVPLICNRLQERLIKNYQVITFLVFVKDDEGIDHSVNIFHRRLFEKESKFLFFQSCRNSDVCFRHHCV